MVRFLATLMETMLMDIKENVYCPWKTYFFLHKFIPLVHHLLFLMMYNIDNSTLHRTWIKWALWIGILLVSVSCVLKALSCSPEFSLRCQMSQAFCEVIWNWSFWECENLSFCTVAENINQSRTAINQPLIWSKRTDRKMCKLVILDFGLRLQRMGDGC
jgi:hypothetical protein